MIGPWIPLGGFDVILQRKDPPVDLEYVYASYILERTEWGAVRCS